MNAPEPSHPDAAHSWRPAPAPVWVRRAFLLLVVASFLLRLAYASVDLGYGRFYDEKYVMANVYSALASDDFRPANGYYASMSWTPQALLAGASHLLWKATDIPLFRVLGDQYPEITPTGFFLARLLQVIFGVGVLCLTFRLAREVFSAEVGVLAVLLLAVMPNQIRLSAFFKPDILVAMLAPAIVLLTLAAARRPSRGRFLLVGILVGIATAAKYTGATLGLPLALVAAALGFAHWRGRRTATTPTSSRSPAAAAMSAPTGPPGNSPGVRHLVTWTIMAGVASVAVFVLVNPHLEIVLSFLPALGDIYETKGARAGGTHLTVVGDAFEILLSPTQHGLLLGLVALVGGVLLAAQCADRRRPFARRLELALVLAVPASYIAAYAVATNIAKANNFLHITPFTALWAAWAVRSGWEWLRDRGGVAANPARRRLATAGWTLATALLAVPAVAYCLDPVIPTAQTQAQATLLAELQPLAHRHVVREAATPRLELQDRLGLAMQQEVAELTLLAPAALDLYDAEVFPASQLDGPAAAFFAARIARLPAAAVRRPGEGPFARGTPLVLLLHPWQAAGPPLRLEVTALDASAAALAAADGGEDEVDDAGAAGAEDEIAAADDAETAIDAAGEVAAELGGEKPADAERLGPSSRGDSPGNTTDADVGDTLPAGDAADDAERRTRRKRRTGQPLGATVNRAPAGGERPLALSTWQIDLPDSLPTGEVVSVAVLLPRREIGVRDVSLRGPHGETFPTVRTRATRRRGSHLTARFVVGPPGERTFELDLRGGAASTRPRAELYLWQSPSPVPPAP